MLTSFPSPHHPKMFTHHTAGQDLQTQCTSNPLVGSQNCEHPLHQMQGFLNLFWSWSFLSNVQWLTVVSPTSASHFTFQFMACVNPLFTCHPSNSQVPENPLRGMCISCFPLILLISTFTYSICQTPWNKVTHTFLKIF